MKVKAIHDNRLPSFMKILARYKTVKRPAKTAPITAESPEKASAVASAVEL